MIWDAQKMGDPFSPPAFEIGSVGSRGRNLSDFEGELSRRVLLGQLRV